MKRPQNMTMRELIALPVVEDRDQLFLRSKANASTHDFGGAFKGDDGHVWGTCRLTTGWVRYPASLTLSGRSRPSRSL